MAVVLCEVVMVWVFVVVDGVGTLSEPTEKEVAVTISVEVDSLAVRG